MTMKNQLSCLTRIKGRPQQLPPHQQFFQNQFAQQRPPMPPQQQYPHHQFRQGPPRGPPPMQQPHGGHYPQHDPHAGNFPPQHHPQMMQQPQQQLPCKCCRI